MCCKSMMNKIILLALSWFSLLVVCCCISNDMRQKRFRIRIDLVKWSNATKSQVWIGIGALALCCPHSTWLPCSTFSQPFYLQLTLSAYQQPMPSFRLNGGCYGNFGRHKSPAARRSEESRKSTLFVSTRAHGERTAVVTRGRRRSGRVANAGQVSSARATCKAACTKNLMLALISQRRHNCTVLLLFL